MLLEMPRNSNKKKNLQEKVVEEFKQAHGWMADKLRTRSGHAAVCKISATILLDLALYVNVPKICTFINALTLNPSDISDRNVSGKPVNAET